MRIPKSLLQKQMVHAASVRAIWTLAFLVVYILNWQFILPEDPKALGLLILPIIFGPPMLLSWAITYWYCRHAVKCPYCRADLWSCGSGNFKARRMRVIAERCPECQVEIG